MPEHALTRIEREEMMVNHGEALKAPFGGLYADAKKRGGAAAIERIGSAAILTDSKGFCGRRISMVKETPQ
jgi:hypothetical protein